MFAKIRHLPWLQYISVLVVPLYCLVLMLITYARQQFRHAMAFHATTFHAKHARVWESTRGPLCFACCRAVEPSLLKQHPVVWFSRLFGTKVSQPWAVGLVHVICSELWGWKSMPPGGSGLAHWRQSCCHAVTHEECSGIGSQPVTKVARSRSCRLWHGVGVRSSNSFRNVLQYWKPSLMDCSTHNFQEVRTALYFWTRIVFLHYLMYSIVSCIQL